MKSGLEHRALLPNRAPRALHQCGAEVGIFMRRMTTFLNAGALSICQGTVRPNLPSARPSETGPYPCPALPRCSLRPILRFQEPSAADGMIPQMAVHAYAGGSPGRVLPVPPPNKPDVEGNCG